MKFIKKAKELADRLDEIPMNDAKNFTQISMEAINNIFSEMHSRDINLDSHFLTTSQVWNSKTAREAYELYFFLKNLDNKEWALDSRGNIVVKSWKNEMILDKKKMKNIASRIEKIRERLLTLHEFKN